MQNKFCLFELLYFTLIKINKMTKVEELDIRDKFSSEIKNQGRKLSWVAETIGMNYNTLYSILVQKTINLSEENKSSINKILGTEY